MNSKLRSVTFFGYCKTLFSVQNQIQEIFLKKNDFSPKHLKTEMIFDIFKGNQRFCQIFMQVQNQI